MTKENERNDEPFIPSLESWGELYTQWYDQLVKALVWFASAAMSDVEDAVQEAFLKIMGLSPNLKLQKPLEPKTLKQWYGFVWWQARSILSHMSIRAAKFKLLPDPDMFPSRQTNRERRLSFLRWCICQAVAEVCKKRRDAEAKARAFIMYELDEMSADEVVAAVPEVLNPNNFYGLCKKIREALAKEAKKPGSMMAMLRRCA